jgi:poly(A) polymerase
MTSAPSEPTAASAPPDSGEDEGSPIPEFLAGGLGGHAKIVDDASFDRQSVIPDAPDDAPDPLVIPVEVPRERIDPDAAKVIRRLRRNDHLAYLVGGGVRDLLLGHQPKDFDIATSARPAEVRALFRNCRVIGRRFRLAHVMFGGGKIIEVATFRRDPAAQDRDDEDDLLITHDNVFGLPHEDARRRDFTINGLFLDTEAMAVIDYVDGMRDLKGKVIRTIGLPDVRFREDPVRILRAIKFSARLDLGVDPEVYDAMIAQRGELERAAKPRVFEELLRLLRGGAAHRSYWLMWETGAMSVLLPSLAAYLDDDGPGARRLWGRLDALDTLKRAGSLPGDAVLVSALLLGVIQDAVGDDKPGSASWTEALYGILDELSMPRRMKERVRAIVASQGRLQRNRLGSLPRRDYFADAATLYRVALSARGKPRPPWLEEALEKAASGEAEEESSGRRRRRRRRRRPADDG